MAVPVERRQIERMIDAIPQFQPEARAVEFRGSFGVGHLLRRITPEDDFESQPLVSRDGNLILAADVRLDNREELASKLHITQPERVPDSVFLLSAYQEWEEGCVDHLLGGFSFVIWDQRRQILFCARDQVGERTFFYHQSDSLVAFRECDSRPPRPKGGPRGTRRTQTCRVHDHHVLPA